MKFVWALCFVQLWALVADVLYVQPLRRLRAVARQVAYAPGAQGIHELEVALGGVDFDAVPAGVSSSS